MDRVLLNALVISLVGHAAVGAVPLIVDGGLRLPDRVRRLQLREAPPAVFQKPAEAPALRRTLRSTLSDLSAAADPGVSGSLQASARALDVLVRPVLSLDPAVWNDGAGPGAGAAAASAREGRWAAAIDLSDVGQAARGNPVLLSYFSAIREQIQRVADEGGWAPQEAASGTVFIGLIINRSGGVRSADVVQERSARAPTLRQTALELVRASAPFPPLPPSYLASSSSMTVLVPIEFSERPPS